MNPLPDMRPGIKNGRGEPHYELRARNHGPDNLELEVWQVPAPATPQLRHPLRIAGLKGRNLALVEHRILRRLARTTIELAGLKQGGRRSCPLDEDLALNLGLLFRVLAPMRNRDHMRGLRRRHRGHGQGGGRLLAGHGHAPQIPSPGTDGAAISSH